MRVLITGGAGYFGSVLKKYLSDKGIESVILDLVPDRDNIKRTIPVQGDIRDRRKLNQVFTKHGPFDVVYHLAAQLAHDVKDKEMLWTSNVDGTENIVKAAIKHKVSKLVFTSSNCLWARPLGRPVREDDKPEPVEIYGKSKWQGEKIIQKYKNYLDSIIIRCPTIISAGRLGLLAILFEFIDENRKVWVVGGGKNVYQFIYGEDLANACLLAGKKLRKTEVYNIGSDKVRSFKRVYQYVIKKAHSSARVATLPKGPTLLAMKLFYKLGLSPLGPYQYKMIAESFVFDTKKIKKELGWKPTRTNEEMLFESYNYYHKHRKEIENSKDSSAHRHGAKLGIIKIVKFFS